MPSGVCRFGRAQESRWAASQRRRFARRCAVCGRARGRGRGSAGQASGQVHVHKSVVSGEPGRCTTLENAESCRPPGSRWPPSSPAHAHDATACSHCLPPPKRVCLRTIGCLANWQFEDEPYILLLTLNANWRRVRACAQGPPLTRSPAGGDAGVAEGGTRRPAHPPGCCQARHGPSVCDTAQSRVAQVSAMGNLTCCPG